MKSVSLVETRRTTSPGFSSMTSGLWGRSRESGQAAVAAVGSVAMMATVEMEAARAAVDLAAEAAWEPVVV